MLCPQKFAWTEVKSGLPLDFVTLILEIVDSVLPWKCESFTHVWLWSYFQWELPGYTQNHKEATTTKIQNKKSCSHLGDQTKAEGFSLSQVFSSYINWMFQVCSAQIAFQANYSKMRKLTLWEDAWLYTGTHTDSLLLIFVTAAISFTSVMLWCFQNLLW